MTDNEVKWLIVGKLLRRNLMAAKGEQWEVLFEGTVTTEESDSPGAYCGGLSLSQALGENNQGDYRLVVDGVTIYKTLYSATTGSILIGNAYLRDESAEDTGEDFHADMWNTLGVLWRQFAFYSRNPGTYKVKIERKVS